MKPNRFSTWVLCVLIIGCAACNKREAEQSRVKPDKNPSNLPAPVDPTKVKKKLSAQDIQKKAKHSDELSADEKEFVRLKVLAGKGDAHSQTLLAHKYALGKGVKQDMKEAVRWYRVAGKKGEPKAQFNLGYMYYNGEGLPRDYAKAADWFRKAAAQGHAGAQGSLGLMYDNGEGVNEDNTEALRLYQLGAKNGDMYSQFNLGCIYDSGEMVPEDNAAAVKWWLKAAAQGHIDVPNYLGSMYNNGEGVPEDDVRAYAWWIIGIGRGDDAPRNNMALLEEELSAEELIAARKLADQLLKEMKADTQPTKNK